MNVANKIYLLNACQKKTPDNNIRSTYIFKETSFILQTQFFELLLR